MNQTITGRTSIAAVFILLSVITCTHAVGQVSIFVSPHGSDKQTGGTPSTAVKTISQALRLSGKIGRSKDRPVNIFLLQGTYFIQQTIRLTMADSFLNILPYKDARVVLTGGKRLQGKWVRTGPRRWQQHVPGSFTQLFEEGRRLTLARYPNQGFLNPSEVDLQKCRLKFGHAIPPAFRQVKDAQLAITGVWHWIVQDIRQFSPVDSSLFTRTAIGPVRSSAKVSVMDRAYFENSASFLDTLDEWYLDTRARTLTLISDKDPNLKSYYYPVTNVLMSLEGSKDKPLEDVRIRHIGFEITRRDSSAFERKGYQAGYWGGDKVGEPTFSPSAAILCRYVGGLKIEECSFRHLGEGAIAFEEGVRHSSIRSNHFEDVGATPIQIARITDFIALSHPLHHDYEDPADAPCYDTLTDNFIRKCASVDLGSVAICVGYANHIVISHNTIMDMPYTGISVGWQWGNALVPTNAHHNAIEWNLVARCMRYLRDGSGIYTCGQQPGSSIKNNWVKDIGEGGIKKWAHGIYTDEGTGGFEIVHNYVERVRGYDFFAHINIWDTMKYHDNNGHTGGNVLEAQGEKVKTLSLPEKAPEDASLYGAGGKNDF